MVNRLKLRLDNITQGIFEFRSYGYRWDTPCRRQHNIVAAQIAVCSGMYGSCLAKIQNGLARVGLCRLLARLCWQRPSQIALAPLSSLRKGQLSLKNRCFLHGTNAHHAYRFILSCFACLALLILMPSAQAQTPSSKDTFSHDMLETQQGRETVFEALVELFREHYWQADYVDWDVWAAEYRQRAYEAKGRFHFESIVRTMIDGLDDDHSRWLGRVPSPLEPADEAPSSKQPRGLGFSYQNLAEAGIVITHVYANSPAHEVGLQRADVVVAIDGTSTLGLGFRKAQTLMTAAREAPATTFRIRRASQVLELELQARPFNFEENQRLPTARMLDSNIGYLYLPSFYHPEVAEYSHDLVADLVQQGARQLVIDMRDNTGGSLSELGLVLGIFLQEESMPWAEAVSRDAVIWQASYRRSQRLEGNNTLIRAYAVLEDADENVISLSRLNTRPATFTGEIAVIITRQNSSAGEIMPWVLQHYRQAFVVGQATLGNTETISPFTLPDGSGVMIAISNLRMGGQLAAKVTPDSQSLEDMQELARGFDAPVAEAIKLLKGTPFSPNKFF